MALVAINIWIILAIKKAADPRLDRAIPYIQALFATFSLVGFSIEAYSIIRYPYLSLVLDDEPPLIVSDWVVWKVLGYTFWFLAALFTLVFLGIMIAPEMDFGALAATGYFCTEAYLAGFILTKYSPIRHPTFATYFHFTHFAGIVAFPLYLPAILIGSFRCRAFFKRVNQSVKPL